MTADEVKQAEEIIQKILDENAEIFQNELTMRLEEQILLENFGETPMKGCSVNDFSEQFDRLVKKDTKLNLVTGSYERRSVNA
jgi:hypothetical protein